MDMSFANQALAAEWVTKKKNVARLSPEVYPVPREIDERIALLKLHTMNVSVDSLSSVQKEYMENWMEGT
jgi:adenosylhomocysteinase